MSSSSPRARALSLFRTLGSTAVKASQEALKRRLANDESDDESISQAALRLAQGLDELKGAAMKAGQMLSLTDEILLPKSWKIALSKLQAEATAKPWNEIEPILLEHLGDKLANVFAHIEPTAIHAASIGQVHQGQLKDGRKVAVKVRYPGLEHSVKADLENLKKLFILTKVFPDRGNYDEILSTVESLFLQELNFTQEREFYEFYKNKMTHLPQFVVPGVIHEVCNEHVLTTEWIEGINFEKWISNRQAHFESTEGAKLRDLVGERFVELIMFEVFQLRTVQTDPNPGNFLIMDDGRIGLVDFGATTPVSDNTISNYSKLVEACTRGTKADVVRVGKEIGFLKGSDAQEAIDIFVRIMTVISQPFLHGDFNWAKSGLAKQLHADTKRFAKATSLRAPPPEIVFLNRRLLGGQLLLEKLGPTVKARDLLHRYTLK